MLRERVPVADGPSDRATPEQATRSAELAATYPALWARAHTRLPPASAHHRSGRARLASPFTEPWRAVDHRRAEAAVIRDIARPRPCSRLPRPLWRPRW